MERQHEESPGSFLQRLRLARGFSQRQLAVAAGISAATLSHWEAGKTSPRIPELDVVLDVLEAEEADRQRLYAAIRAPRARARLARSAPKGEIWLPSAGELLRALRRRKGLSLEQAAAVLGVWPSTVHRWERTGTMPSAALLDVYCAALGAYPEERCALDEGFGLDAGTRESLEAQCEQLRCAAMGGEEALVELRFLALEAQLWARSARDRFAERLLVRTWIWHAQWLLWRGRLEDAGPMAGRALAWLERTDSPDPGAFRAVHIYANFLVDRSRRPDPARGLRFLNDWLPVARWPRAEAWVRHNIATYQFRTGAVEEARRMAERADAVALRSDDPQAIRNSRSDRASMLLRCGESDLALALLSAEHQSNIYHRVFEAHLWETALTAVGEADRAAAWRARVQATVGEFALPSAYRVAPCQAAVEASVSRNGSRRR